MSTLKKIAILRGDDDLFSFEVDEIRSAFAKSGIETKLFYESDTILTYAPDCVISTSPQNAKLTPFPTYGLINMPRDDYLELPRFLRNILTYDGYLSFSPRLTMMLRDIMFGARKLGSGIFNIDFFPVSARIAPQVLDDKKPQIVIFDPDFSRSNFKNATYLLLEKFENCKVITFSINNVKKYHNRFIAVSSIDELNQQLSQFSIGICLNGGDQQEGIINPAVIKLIASGIITITHSTDQLKSYFNDNLYYLSPDVYADSLIGIVTDHLESIASDKENAMRKITGAHQIFLEKFAFDNKVPDFIKFHEETLINKGYLPNPDSRIESALPSVTYIMRTGGKHRPFLERALECLVDQKYPDLRVIFVTHVKVPFINEIITQYPTIKFKVIESIKSRRSEAIRDGMAAVETDLFGLFDDDDELFPNHVRMLVKTMQYQSNRDWRGEIGMVYSGSIHADDTYPVFERTEFHDHKLVGKNEKRAIEHFKFYSPSLMSQHAWFMPNGWLARSSLIDEELLVDPAIDTCEDLYFELQIAQRRHFAFSVEVTAIHNFHHLGNSTIDDSHKHLPDTQRIALRNFSRTFAPEALYDTGYNIVGRVSCHDTNQIKYQDYVSVAVKEYKNPFYPFRYKESVLAAVTAVESKIPTSRAIGLFVKSFGGIRKFVKADKYRKEYYFEKFKSSIKQYGLYVTFLRILAFLSRSSSDGSGLIFIPSKKRNFGIINRLVSKFRGMLQFVGLGRSR